MNEAHVLMRLLTERALNLCYLLVTPQNEGAKGLEKASAETATETRGAVAEELIKHAKAFRFKETYDCEALELRIKVVAANTKIPIEFLRLVVSSHYPHASLALSGSPAGAVFHMVNVTEEDDDLFSSNFATLLFAGVTLLNYVVKVLGTFGAPEILIKDSDASSDAIADLMLKARRPAMPNVQDAHGWWQSLSDHEYFAVKKLAPHLKKFNVAFAACLEAGVAVPVEAKQNRSALRLRICALYLKRLLNDVRSVWLMIERGNTSQAGSIAASLFENAVLIECLAEDETRAIQFGKSKLDKWPWSKREMCRLVNQDAAKRENRKPDQKVAAAHYAQYAWLCEIKHPTLSYVTHESGSTGFKKEGYAVLPFPDIRDEDWPVKEKIMLISLHNAIMAVEAFARGGGIKETTRNEIRFATNVKTVHIIIEEYLEHRRGPQGGDGAGANNRSASGNR